MKRLHYVTACVLDPDELDGGRTHAILLPVRKTLCGWGIPKGRKLALVRGGIVSQLLTCLHCLRLHGKDEMDKRTV